MTEILRTPDERFEDLPDFPYTPYYVEDLRGYEGLRMGYVDVGPREAERVALCLHGQPTWSYLYRAMIPVLVAADYRVVVPDLFGFGRSDKPVDEEVYTFDFHRASLLAFADRLGLEGVTLVVHDWGGLLGLTLPVDRPRLAERLVVTNTALGTGTVELPEGFVAWRQWVRDHPDMEVGGLMARARPGLTEGERAAYDAPFPDARSKAGVRRFPELVPDRPDAPGAEVSRHAARFWKSEWAGESFLAVGMQDPVLGPQAMRPLQRLIRGCPEAWEIPDAGHFVPDEAGEEIARRALAAFAQA